MLTMLVDRHYVDLFQGLGSGNVRQHSAGCKRVGSVACHYLYIQHNLSTAYEALLWDSILVYFPPARTSVWRNSLISEGKVFYLKLNTLKPKFLLVVLNFKGSILLRWWKTYVNITEKNTENSVMGKDMSLLYPVIYWNLIQQPTINYNSSIYNSLQLLEHMHTY